MQINELIYELRLQKELNNIEEYINENFEDSSQILEAVNYILSQEDLDINQKLEAIDNLLTELNGIIIPPNLKEAVPGQITSGTMKLSNPIKIPQLIKNPDDIQKIGGSYQASTHK